jgi:hypothetical protein
MAKYTKKYECKLAFEIKLSCSVLQRLIAKVCQLCCFQTCCKLDPLGSDGCSMKTHAKSFSILFLTETFKVGLIWLFAIASLQFMAQAPL